MPTPGGAPAAATTAVRGLLTGPAVTAVVRGVFPSALYLDTGDEMVAVVTVDALRLPCALVLAEHSSYRPFGTIGCGDAATVGDGGVAAGDRRFVVRRWWRPRIARTLHPGQALEHRVGALAALLPDPVDVLPAEGAAPEPATLVGRGPGLTPAGDDFLAAMLVTLSAAPVAETQLTRLTAATTAVLGRTTSLSATLLLHAQHGRGVPELLDVVDALGGSGELATTARRLLTVGHSSGAALAHGVLAAGRLVVSAAASPTLGRKVA